MTKSRFFTWVLFSAVGALAPPRVAEAILVIPDTPAMADTLVNLPGYLSYTFMVDPEGANITGFDAKFTSTMMHQVHPEGADTHFKSFAFPPSVAPYTPAEDSQFDMIPGSGIWAGSLPAPFADRGVGIHASAQLPGELTAGLAGATAPVTTMFSLAHIVIPVGATGTWEFTPVVNGVIPPNSKMSGSFGAVPEASQVIIGILATISLLGYYVARQCANRRWPAEGRGEKYANRAGA